MQEKELEAIEMRAKARGMEIVVKDKKGNEYYSPLYRNLFESIKGDIPVFVYEKDTMVQKQFLRGYLEFVSTIFKVEESDIDEL